MKKEKQPDYIKESVRMLNEIVGKSFTDEEYLDSSGKALYGLYPSNPEGTPHTSIPSDVVMAASKNEAQDMFWGESTGAPWMGSSVQKIGDPELFIKNLREKLNSISTLLKKVREVMTIDPNAHI
jgi:hypothetical protein